MPILCLVDSLNPTCTCCIAPTSTVTVFYSLPITGLFAPHAPPSEVQRRVISYDLLESLGTHLCLHSPTTPRASWFLHAGCTRTRPSSPGTSRCKESLETGPTSKSVMSTCRQLSVCGSLWVSVSLSLCVSLSVYVSLTQSTSVDLFLTGRPLAVSLPPSLCFRPC